MIIQDDKIYYYVNDWNSSFILMLNILNVIVLTVSHCLDLKMFAAFLEYTDTKKTIANNVVNDEIRDWTS